MSPNVVRGLQNAVPFQPYVIRTVDGKAIHVPSREFLSMNPSGRTIFVWETNGNFNFLDSILISRIEMVNGTPAPNAEGNGPSA